MKRKLLSLLSIAAFLNSGYLVQIGQCAQSTSINPFTDTFPRPTSSSDSNMELSNATDLLAQEDGLRRVAAQQLEAQVKSELRQSRISIGRDPSASKLSLKNLQDQIRRAPELDASDRTRLDSQIAPAIQSAARAEVNLREQISRTEAVQSTLSKTR